MQDCSHPGFLGFVILPFIGEIIYGVTHLKFFLRNIVAWFWERCTSYSYARLDRCKGQVVRRRKSPSHLCVGFLGRSLPSSGYMLQGTKGVNNLTFLPKTEPSFLLLICGDDTSGFQL